MPTFDSAAVTRLLYRSDLGLRLFDSSGNIAVQADETNGVEVSAAGVVKVALTPSGRVGAGVALPTYAVDASGDVNAGGVFRKGGTAGESVTLTYLTGTPAAGQSSKTVTFSGGIETSH